MISTQFFTSIKVFRSDSGGEFISNEFKSFLLSEGTLAQLSCPYTPQQNGVAERKHRHIIETTRTLLLSSNLPKVFWGEAALTAIYLINRLPSSSINMDTPYHKLFVKHLIYLHLRPFGYVCFVLLPSTE